MIRAVLDTNTLISGLITPQGVPAQIVRHWHQGDFLLITSPMLLDELRRVLNYPHIAARLGWTWEQRHRFLETFETLALITKGNLTLPDVTRDPKDDPVVATAVEGEAAFIVSGDQDLLVLETYASVQILTPREFLTLLETHLD